MKLTLRFALAVALSGVPAAAADKAAPSPAITTSQPTAALESTVTDGAVTAAIPVPATPMAGPQPVTAMIGEPPQVKDRHGFFDMKNCVAITAVAAGLTGDAFSTQKGLGRPGFYEVNPIARPFVQNRPGAALYGATSFALMGGGMYLAHKMNHHKLERILPFAVAGWEGFLTFRNYHLISNATTRP